MYKFLMILILMLLIASGVNAQVNPEIDAKLERREHTFQSLTLPYRLHVPFGYSHAEKYPLLVFLHGAKWAGTDNVTQLDNELALYWIDSTRQELEACFVIYPQIPKGHTWEYTRGQVFDLPASPELATVNDIVSSLMQEFSIDDNRIYISGKSIGALGVYGMLARYPERYAAAVPAAGYYLYRTIGELSNSAMWIFHNRDDNVVNVEQPRHVVSELQDSGYRVVHTHCRAENASCEPIPTDSIDAVIQRGERFFYSEFDDSGHQLEPNVVATYGLYAWLMAQEKTSTRVNKILPQRFTLMNFPNPFNTSTIIQYNLLEAATVQLEIVNTLGQSVRVFKEKYHQPGTYRVHWNGVDEQGENVGSGVYVCCLRINNVLFTSKLILLR